MRVLILGCGYVGMPLGAELVRQGHEVFGVRRSASGLEELTAAGVHPLRGDVTKPGDLAQLPGPFDWVVNTVCPSTPGVEDYRQVCLEGTRHLLDWLAPMPPRKFIYTSCTSVYGQTDGALAKEDSPTQPASAPAQQLVAAEQLLREAVRDRKFPAVILRVSELYGPGRGPRFLRYLRNEARIAGQGERLINMIHQDDLVTALLAALRSGRAGEVYNASDDEPIAEVHFFRWLSESLGKWMPPFATAAETAELCRHGANPRVSNRRLKMELGVRLKYPTFRQGYTAEIQRLDRAGLLDLAPEPR